MNDICNISSTLKFVLFADGTNIFTSNNDIAKQYSEANRELYRLFTWLCVNKLSIIIEKTNYIIFSNIYEILVTSIGINDKLTKSLLN